MFPPTTRAGVGLLVLRRLRQLSAVGKTFLRSSASQKIFLAIFVWPGPGRAASEGWCPQVQKTHRHLGHSWSKGLRGCSCGPGALDLLNTVEPGLGRGAPGPWSSSGDGKFLSGPSGPAGWLGHWNTELRSSPSGKSDLCDGLVVSALGIEWTTVACILVRPAPVKGRTAEMEGFSVAVPGVPALHRLLVPGRGVGGVSDLQHRCPSSTTFVTL